MRPKINSNDFGFFLELISRFEFEFLRCGNFLNGFEFLVCSKFNHTHHVAVNVPVQWPVCAHPNSISNVVVSLTIHDNIYINISIKEM